MTPPAFTIVAGIRWPSTLVWELRGPDGRVWHKTTRKKGQRHSPASFHQMRERYELAYILGHKDANNADADSM